MAGWQVKALGEVCNIIGGGTPSKANKNFFNGDIYWATVRDMRKDVITTTQFKITEEAVKNSSTNIIKAGNVVIATRVGLGKVCLINQDTAINQDLRGIVPIDSSILLVRYLFWWLKSIAHLIEGEGTGATVKGVKLPFVKSLQIPLPPLTEQERIVAILDKASAGISLAVGNAEKNLANACELFESYLNNVFTQKGEGWEEKLLSSVCIVERGSSPRPIKSFLTDDPNGVNWVKIGDTKGIVKFISSTKQKITKEGAERSRAVYPGDFILTNSMSYGRPYIMSTSGYIHDGWFVLRLAENIDTDFFYYLLSSRVVQDQFGSLAAGAIVKNISGDLVKKTLLPIPPVSEQRRLVEAIEKLSSETQHLKNIYEQKLTSLNELKQSILQQAFSGKLTSAVDER